MKKKILLLVALISVIVTATLLFAGCGAAPTQGQLTNIWNSHENFVYEVTDKSTATTQTGTYTVDILRCKAGDITFGDGKLTNAPAGYLITGDLVIGENTVKTQAYFQMVKGTKYVSSYATYRKENINGVEFSMNGNYDGNTLNYSKTSDGKTTNGSLSCVEPYYDNNVLHQTLRSISTYAPAFTFTFNTPIVAASEQGVAQLNISVIEEQSIKTKYTEAMDAESDFHKNGIKCYGMLLRRNVELSSMGHEIYIAENSFKVNDAWPVKNCIVKIVEHTNVDQFKGSVTYELKSITL